MMQPTIDVLITRAKRRERKSGEGGREGGREGSDCGEDIERKKRDAQPRRRFHGNRSLP